MSVITVFSGIFCGEQDVIADVIASTGYRSVIDSDILPGKRVLHRLLEACGG